jgi:phenylalanyl-tRNA synthetase alpha chain
MSYLTAAQLDAALARRDLTDPTAGEHAVQHVVARIEKGLAAAWGVPVRRDPGPRIVTVKDNYDRLRYDGAAVTRDRRYSRYVDADRMLRSHTTARVPALLDGLGETETDVLLSVPGMCYRRDAIDRQHVGEPHQHDLWRIRNGDRLTTDDLDAMIRTVVAAVLPGRHIETPPSPHPYTLHGREIYVDGVEIGECGLAHPDVLRGSGLPDTASGLAMGLGLDRITMLVKGIDDIRLLRATDPRIADQMRDLGKYHPVSAMPATSRDLSLAVADDQDAEQLGDRVRAVLGDDATAIEEIEVRSETGHDELPESARRRMGLRPGQKNVLLRLVLRDLDRTLSTMEANAIRDRVYEALHEGTAHEWAAR